MPIRLLRCGVLLISLPHCARKSAHARIFTDVLVHMDIRERLAQQAVVDGPRSAAHGSFGARHSERRLAVEQFEEFAAGLKLSMNPIRFLVAPTVGTSVPLEHDRGVIGERLKKKHVMPEPTDESLKHG